ncbi:MAG: isochorismatase family protein [Pseudomonadota bacterium]|nr:isochorismatase family protein [Pseudomonadota bacterium]
MDDTSKYASQGFGGTVGFGQRPALLIIDFTVGFADPAIFGGGNIPDAIQNTARVLTRARDAGMPVAHTKIIYAEDGSDQNLHTNKVPKLLKLTEANPASDFDPAVYPVAGETVVRKRLPSAFFGTDLAGVLMAKGVDTLLIAGCTTSGCVRASALDALCYGFRPIIMTDCVGDRAKGPHDATLFDLSQKYADLFTSDEAMDAALAARANAPQHQTA